MRIESHAAYRTAFALALTAGFIIVFMNVAAGLIGIEDDDPANLLYVAVLAIGFVGAILARFRARGLARAAAASAVAIGVVGAIALMLPNTASAVQIVLLHGAFVAMFAGSALLFRRAARGPESLT